MELHGRRVIYTDATEITKENVLDVLAAALSVHEQNRTEIQYLYDYYKGKQPILGRVKEFREDICNKIVENRANEIVSFKVGYLIGEPVQYVSRNDSESESTLRAINTLNEYMFAEDKAAKDKELADWFSVCGTAFRLVLPDSLSDQDEAPFEIYTLDPRNAFVVYNSGLGNQPVMGVRYVLLTNGTTVYSVYTKNKYFEVTGEPVPGIVTKEEGHIFGGVPLVEYPANSARLGAFEIVLPLLDALNTVASNRIDGVEQFIQSLLVLLGTAMPEDGFKQVKELGGLGLPEGADAKYLTQELNQQQTQTLVDSMYQTVLVICGMPNRNGGSSTSDTGSAVIMRDGWSDAEARAKDSELMFKKAEKQALRLVLEYCDAFRELGLKLSAIDIRFTRRNYENIQAKAQVLCQLLNNNKVHPRLAYEHCGLFADPDLAYTQSMKYAEERLKQDEKALEDDAKRRTKDAQQAASEGNE